MPAVSHSVEVDVSPERFYALIVDFPSYPTFAPNQSAARIVDHDGERWRIEFELQVAKVLRYTLDLTGVPGESLRWSLVEGDMMTTNEGGWTLAPLDGGRRTHVTYEMDVELKGFVPRSVSRLLVERTLPANVQAFKLEAERRG